MSGVRGWILSLGMGQVRTTPYAEDVVVHAKLLPFGPGGAVAIVRGTLVEGTTDSRAGRPYPPTAVTINTESYPETIAGELVLAWSHRNRLAEWSYANAGATAAPEPGTHYRVTIYGDDDELKHTEDDITAAGYTYPEATEKAENGGNWNSTLRIVIESLRDDDGTPSWQAFDWTVDR
jgi:hypothetical protein